MLELAPDSSLATVRHIALPTGELTLRTTDPAALDRLCAFAARANPKRGFLVVSRVLGRHLPARPADMRRAMAALAAQLAADLPGPIAFLGMAETATALAQGTFAAWRAANPSPQAIYLQTSRQIARGAEVIARFEEGHSHATSHMVQIADPAIAATLRAARSLVIVDDECSTGGTFAEAAQAMAAAMPALEQVHCCALTDWSDGAFLARIPFTAARHALLNGRLEWQAAEGQFASVLGASANGHGQAPATGMRSRTGLTAPEAAQHAALAAVPGERVLVLGDGEHAYEALRMAESIEEAGGIAAVQSITRTPAMLGHAMDSVTRLGDAYGSGATCFLYNVLAHAPARILIAAEHCGTQGQELAQALAEMGSAVPVELVHCRYGEGPAA